MCKIILQSFISIAVVVLFSFVYSCKDDATSPLNGGHQVRVLNRIFFISNRETPRSSQIYSVNPDGSNMLRITYPKDSISYYYAVWSPDLTKMAVVWNYSDYRRREFPMMSMADSSGNLLYLLSNVCYPAPPVWSPDGSEIAFSVPKGSFAVVPQVFAVAADGGVTRQITSFQLSSPVDTSAMLYAWNKRNELYAIIHFDSTYYVSPDHKGSVKWGSLAQLDFSGRLVRNIFYDGIKEPWHADIAATSEKVVCNYWRYGSITGLLIIPGINQSPYMLGNELFYQQDGKVYGRVVKWSPSGDKIAFSMGITANRPSKTFHSIYLSDPFGTGTSLLVGDSATMNYVIDWR